MSIIYEALRKIQNSSKGAFRANPNAPSKSAADMRPSFKREIVLAFVGITAGIFVVWLITGLGKRPQAIPPPPPSALPEAAPGSPASPAVNVTPSIAAEEKTSEPKIPELILNGIVLSEDGNLALIQEQILKVGDDIEGAKIEEITDKQVTLAFQGQKIVLKKK